MVFNLLWTRSAMPWGVRHTKRWQQYYWVGDWQFLFVPKGATVVELFANITLTPYQRTSSKIYFNQNCLYIHVPTFEIKKHAKFRGTVHTLKITVADQHANSIVYSAFQVPCVTVISTIRISKYYKIFEISLPVIFQASKWSGCASAFPYYCPDIHIGHRNLWKCKRKPLLWVKQRSATQSSFI